MREDFTFVDTIEICSDYTSLSTVEQFIDQMCAELSISDDLYGNVLIAVSEAVNNAIQHGNVFSSELNVTVSISNSLPAFCFSIHDQGKGFDILLIPDPTSPDNINRENGRGIFLMNNLADEVEFLNNGSIVNLYFNK